MKKILFMGTPEFSVPILERLASDYQVIGVVTQPDRPVGRKRILTPPPVKKKALELGLKVYQPEKLRTSEELAELLTLDMDLLVTAAYGQILPVSLLEAPRFGSINVHASLLPEYRGGAPVHYAVLDGQPETGVTIMYMVKELDAGDMLTQRKIPITDQDDTGTMFVKLSQLGAELLMDTLPKLFAGDLTAIPQDTEKVTFARNISREQEKIDWNRTAREIFNQVRGLSPWPVAYTTLTEKPFKIWQAKLTEETSTTPAGSFYPLGKNRLGITAGDGKVVELLEVQPAGKPKMPTASFMQGTGRDLNEKTRFGD
ncbi:methionyl-tRNA formyltransferase [Listeria ilorinensis]|uniref:methionyl-tRNA formyltransferase n=1 Tax=Listeria ilorinensis TaxID=2867439 RepID=UPI001EF6DEBB|nr:methionyl-tRNA formyltransferase [Listeria ilorinensis]